MSSTAEIDSFQPDRSSLSDMMPGLIGRMQVRVLEIMANSIVDTPIEPRDGQQATILVGQGIKEVQVTKVNGVVRQVSTVVFGYDDLGHMPATVQFRKDIFRKNADVPFYSRAFALQQNSEHRLSTFGQSLATLFKAKRLSNRKPGDLSLPSSI